MSRKVKKIDQNFWRVISLGDSEIWDGCFYLSMAWLARELLGVLHGALRGLKQEHLTLSLYAV